MSSFNIECDPELIAEDLPYSQMSCNSGTTFNSTNITTYIEITPWTLDSENNTSVVEFNSGNSRITVKEDGAYQIAFQISGDSQDTDQNIYFTVLKNGTTELDGARVENTFNTLSNIDAYANTFVAELVAGDEVSLWMADDKDGFRISGSCTFAVVRLRGSKGVKGDTGSGSNVTVEDSGTPLTATPHATLNFLNELSATNNAGVADIDLTTVPITKGGTGQITNTLGFNALSPVTTKGDLIVRDSTNNIRLPVGSNDQVLLADSAQASGVKWAAVPMTSGDTTGHYFPEQSIKVATFTRAGGLWIFPGSTSFGTPTKAEVIARVDASATGVIRLFDVTNSLVIATSAGFTNTANAIINLGTLSNIPASDAIFEWQFRRSAGGGNNSVYTVGGIITT